MHNTHIIIKCVGYFAPKMSNWCYRFYDVTIISNDTELLSKQGIYFDQFGSVTNYFSELREKRVDFILDTGMSGVKQSMREMKRLKAGDDLKAIISLL